MLSITRQEYFTVDSSDDGAHVENDFHDAQCSIYYDGENFSVTGVHSDEGKTYKVSVLFDVDREFLIELEALAWVIDKRLRANNE